MTAMCACGQPKTLRAKTCRACHLASTASAAVVYEACMDCGSPKTTRDARRSERCRRCASRLTFPRSQAEYGAARREAVRALIEVHEPEFRRLLRAAYRRQDDAKRAAQAIQPPLMAVVRDAPKGRGRPRAEAWSKVEWIRDMCRVGTPVEDQAAALGICVRTLERIYEAQGIRKGVA